MLKKIKWTLLGLVAILIIIGTYVISLVRYAEGEVATLENYTASILAMEEVESLNSIHRFNGLESYIVASVVHEGGQDVYFFVRDVQVQYYFFAEELIDEEEANAIAQNLMENGMIINTQLGILEGVLEDEIADDEESAMPIFEVQIEDEDAVYYIVINAQTSEVVLNFPAWE